MEHQLCVKHFFEYRVFLYQWKTLRNKFTKQTMKSILDFYFIRLTMFSPSPVSDVEFAMNGVVN